MPNLRVRNADVQAIILELPALRFSYSEFQNAAFRILKDYHDAGVLD